MSGTVNISRRLFDSEAFRDEVFTEREAWVWLVMAASWKERSVRSGDYVINTERGQLAHSIRYMAKAWKWTPAKAQRYLKRIEKLKMIRTETDTGVSVITICKYNEYQGHAKASDTATIQHRYSTDTEKKKDERREEGKVKKPRGFDDTEVTSILSSIVPESVAADFVGHRRDLKKPMTPRAAALMVKRLHGHHDPTAVLQDSIQNGWQGIFPEKIKPQFSAINGGRNEQPSSKSQNRMDAFIAGARGSG